MTKWLVRNGDRRLEAGVGEFRSRRSEDKNQEDSETARLSQGRTVRRLTMTLAGLTVLILLYCLISAVNARAVFLEGENRFEYFDNYVKWLPHSYDSASTWKVFWQYVGLACFFWATRDWLLGKSTGERRNAIQVRLEEGDWRPSEGGQTSEFGSRKSAAAIGSPTAQQFVTPYTPSRETRVPNSQRKPTTFLPIRLQRLLWVLCINGAVLALEGILQRLSGTNQLLWLTVPSIHKSTDAQFGPFAYRGNAAQYLNLIWPTCLGFWLVLQKDFSSFRRLGDRTSPRTGKHIILLPCAVLIAAASILTLSRGGMLIATLNLLAIIPVILWSADSEKLLVRSTVVSLLFMIFMLSSALGLEKIAKRFETVLTDRLSGRIAIYENAARMGEDHLLYGTGPGSFASIYLLYKKPNQLWEAYVHNDWLETQITFGWMGLILLFATLVTQFAISFSNPRSSKKWRLVACISIATGSCLIHALFDFPFQIYSILHLFILCGAVLHSPFPTKYV